MSLSCIYVCVLNNKGDSSPCFGLFKVALQTLHLHCTALIVIEGFIIVYAGHHATPQNIDRQTVQTRNAMTILYVQVMYTSSRESLQRAEMHIAL